ncbi:CAP domain-containing protein [Cytobacillus luteolus]|nr:CAP domain-containing protein [Cytobacillus luteolus]MBP1941925.1 uncharacterized protein YkwD [Cytobacillus luteolus]
MRRLILLFAFLLFLFSAWSTFEKWLEKNKLDVTLNTLKTDIDEIRASPEYIAAVGTIQEGIIQLMDQLDQRLQTSETDVNSKTEVQKPELITPTKQAFSIYNVELGETRSEIEKRIGSPIRSTPNEYGLMWNAYHDNYQNFIMISYNVNDEVVGLYTPHDLISSTHGIERGSVKASVIEKLGVPLNKIRKGMTYYQFEKDRDYDVFLVDNSYVTVFYDQHQQDTVTSIQIVSEEVEKSKKEFYTASSDTLKEGFEYQLFDLTNATRVNHELPILSWDDHVKETARKHSLDMAQNNYFSHTNLEGQSPFDRMLEDDILFTVAGENLAYGQFSSIFAHEGLMNSLGHRENILQPDFRNLGVGVAFNTKSQPYYTQKFYSN